MQDIKIGTLITAPKAPKVIPQILHYGFETFSLTWFGQEMKDVDLKAYANEIQETLAGSDASISSLSIFGNPLVDDNCLDFWKDVIDHAADFGCELVTGFTGRIKDTPVPKSMPRFKEVWTELGHRAQDKNVRLAFENCTMNGDWKTGDFNIAFSPVAWEMMFDAVPLENIGLQWEPCHQMVQLVDPIPQLREWLKKGKIFNIHGKDATIAWDIVRKYGISGVEKFAWHRTPGFGDCNWTDIISILRMHHYVGTIDIEGHHDPVYHGALEYTGQVHALNYLKNCRGGDYLANPELNL